MIARRKGRAGKSAGGLYRQAAGHSSFGAVVGVVAAMAFAGPALAQVTAPAVTTGVQADPRRVFGDDAPALGGLDIIAGIGLNFRASLVTEYSDNIARQADGEPLDDRFDSKSDWLFRPSIGVDAGRALGRQQLFVSAELGRDFYARNEILNRSRFRIDGGVNWALGQRCGGRVQGGWSTRGTQFDLFEEVVPSTQERTSFFASASCRTSGGLSGSLAYDYSQTKNDSGETESGETVDRSFADVRSHGLSASLGYAIGRRGDVGVQGSWRDLTYPNQILTDGSTNGTEINSGSIYVNYRVGPSFRVNGSLGASRVKPKAPDVEDFSGGIWSLGLSYSGPRLGASLSGGRNVSGSTGGQGNYQIADYFNATATYRANDRLRFSTGYARTNQENRGVDEVPETETLRNFKTDRVFAAADYALNRILSFGFDVNYRTRSSEPDDFDYDETSVVFAIRAAL